MKSDEFFASVPRRADLNSLAEPRPLYSAAREGVAPRGLPRDLNSPLPGRGVGLLHELAQVAVACPARCRVLPSSLFPARKRYEVEPWLKGYLYSLQNYLSILLPLVRLTQ